MTDTPKCPKCGTEDTTVQLRNGASIVCCPACYYRESGCLEAGIVAKDRRIRELEAAALATDAQIAELQAEVNDLLATVNRLLWLIETEHQIDGQHITADAHALCYRLTFTRGTAAEETEPRDE